MNDTAAREDGLARARLDPSEAALAEEKRLRRSVRTINLSGLDPVEFAGVFTRVKKHEAWRVRTANRPISVLPVAVSGS